MRWFRFYSEVRNDPKALSLPPPLFRYWVLLLCVANDGRSRGCLPPIRDIALELRVPARRAEVIVETLKERGLLEEIDGALMPHNWAGRQFASDDAVERVRKHRRNASPVVTVTDLQRPQSTDNRVQTTETEPEEAAAASPVLALLATSYEAEIGSLSPGMTDGLKEWAERIPNNGSGEAAIRYAFGEAVTNNRRRWRYVQSILERLETERWPADPGQEAGRARPEQDDEAEHKRYHHKCHVAGKPCWICGAKPEKRKAASRRR